MKLTAALHNKKTCLATDLLVSWLFLTSYHNKTY
jgi:hypothetical protein